MLSESQELRRRANRWVAEWVPWFSAAAAGFSLAILVWLAAVPARQAQKNADRVREMREEVREMREEVSRLNWLLGLEDNPPKEQPK